MRARLIPWALALLAVIPAGAAVLTMQSAEDAALENNPTIKALQAAERTATVQARGSWALRDPELRLSYGEGDREADDEVPDFLEDPTALPESEERNSEQYQAALRVYPPNPFAAKAAGRVGDARIRLAEANTRLVSWETIVAVRRAYVRIQYFRKCVALGEERVQSAEARRELVRQMQESGGTTSLDAAGAATDYLDAVTRLESLRVELALAESDLAGWLDIDDPESLELVVDMSSELPDLKDLVKHIQTLAVDHKPDVAVQMWTVQALEYERQVARRSNWLWPSHIQLAYGEERGMREEQSWEVQAAFPIPVISATTTTDDDVLAAELEQARAELVAVRRQAEITAKQALRGVLIAARHFSEIQESTSPLSRELETLITENRDRSGLSLEALADLEKRLYDVNRLLLEAEYLLSEAVVTLEEAVGIDLDQMVSATR